MASVVPATSSEFDSVTARGSVVVAFGAPWCSPCRSMEPVLERLARSGISVVKVDCDESPELGVRYSVRGIPTYVALQDGSEVGRLTGQQTLDRLAGMF